MKLGTQVGLGPDHIVLDGDPAPLTHKGSAPNFRPMSVVAGWIKMPLGMEVGLGTGDFVLDGDLTPPSAPQKGGKAQPPIFDKSIVAKRSTISRTAELFFINDAIKSANV